MRYSKTRLTKCPIAEEHKMFRTRRPDQRSGNDLADLCFYHWSPQSRRNSINHQGLIPGCLSLQGDWRPPYVSFSDDANLAWALSGAIHSEINKWDLWMCYPERVGSWEIIFDTYPFTNRHYIKEYRVYHRVFKRHVDYLASRSTNGR